MKAWFQQKTTLLGIGTILGSVGGYLAGSVDPMTAIQGLIAGFGMIFMRQAIQENKTAIVENKIEIDKKL